MWRPVSPRRTVGAAALLILSLVAACAPAPPPTPTAAPTQAPAPAAKPTTAPAAAPAASPTTAPASAPKPTLAASPAAAADDFYRGKTVRIQVGYSTGGGYDTWARIVARSLAKHLPGSPTVVVENVTGAGSLTAANQVYNQAPKDGTVIGMFASTLLLNQLKHSDGVNMDMGKYQWLGAVTSTTVVCQARTDTPHGTVTLDDLVGGKLSQPLVVGSTAPGDPTDDYPKLLVALLGANLKIVPGYQGSTQIRQAIESGELDGWCLSWDSMKSATRSWKESGTPVTSYIVQEGPTKVPEIGDVPLARDLAKNASDKQLFQVVDGPLAFQYPFAVPPGVPAERVEMLRKAFADTFDDPDLKADAAKAVLDSNFQPGAKIQSTVTELLATPSDVVNRLKTVLPS